MGIHPPTGLLRKSIFYSTPLNPPGGTYLNPVSYKAPLGGFGGINRLLQPNGRAVVKQKKNHLAMKFNLQ
jgi:hypothetical protein